MQNSKHEKKEYSSKDFKSKSSKSRYLEWLIAGLLFVNFALRLSLRRAELQVILHLGLRVEAARNSESAFTSPGKTLLDGLQEEGLQTMDKLYSGVSTTVLFMLEQNRVTSMR